MGSDARAREKYRNALFEREAKAATSLLEQVRQYVGRAGKCHVSDFEDLCTIHHAISNLYQRVRRSSNLEAMPRVYRSPVKAPERTVDREPELLMLGGNALEAQAARPDAAPPPSPPLFDLVRKVPEVTVEELCRGKKKSPSPRPSSRNARKRPAPKAAQAPVRPPSSPKTPDRRTPVAVAELQLEVFLELKQKAEVPEMRLEIQVCEMPSRSPLRSLRITNKHGSVGSVVLEVHRLRRAELCMALVKETQDTERPRLCWDESEDFSVLSPDGARNADVASALRVPVTQLLAACAAGASLEWEADQTRCLVVKGSLSKAGRAVEYISGQLGSPAKTPEPAGKGYQAAQTLREPKEMEAKLVKKYVSRKLVQLLERGLDRQESPL